MLFSYLTRLGTAGPGKEVRRRLASEAKVVGWRQAVLDTLQEYPSLFQYVADERSADWRFLLPALPRGEALCIGSALSPVPLNLARTCQRVVVLCPEEDGAFLMLRVREEGIENIEVNSNGTPSGEYDLVAGLRSAPNRNSKRWGGVSLSSLAELVRRGGDLYLEIDRPALLLPPKVLERRLKRQGFVNIRSYWPKPTFSQCEMMLPLGDRRVQRYYLSHVFFAMSLQRRLLRSVLSIAIKLGLFELTLPGYMVVAQASQAKRAPEGHTLR